MKIDLPCMKLLILYYWFLKYLTNQKSFKIYYNIHQNYLIILGIYNLYLTLYQINYNLVNHLIYLSNFH